MRRLPEGSRIDTGGVSVTWCVYVYTYIGRNLFFFFLYISPSCYLMKLCTHRARAAAFGLTLGGVRLGVWGVLLVVCVCRGCCFLSVYVCDLLIFLHIAPERPGRINRKERARAALETTVLRLWKARRTAARHALCQRNQRRRLQDTSKKKNAYFLYFFRAPPFLFPRVYPRMTRRWIKTSTPD